MDTDDEVRDRATYFYHVLNEKDKALSSAYILNSKCTHSYGLFHSRKFMNGTDGRFIMSIFLTLVCKLLNISSCKYRSSIRDTDGMFFFLATLVAS